MSINNSHSEQNNGNGLKAVLEQLAGLKYPASKQALGIIISALQEQLDEALVRMKHSDSPLAKDFRYYVRTLLKNDVSPIAIHKGYRNDLSVFNNYVADFSFRGSFGWKYVTGGNGLPTINTNNLRMKFAPFYSFLGPDADYRPYFEEMCSDKEIKTLIELLERKQLLHGHFHFAIDLQKSYDRAVRSAKKSGILKLTDEQISINRELLQDNTTGLIDCSGHDWFFNRFEAWLQFLEEHSYYANKMKKPVTNVVPRDLTIAEQTFAVKSFTLLRLQGLNIYDLF